jgi:type VI secretion system protein ImpK
MSPEFASATDPLFLCVLDLLDRIGKSEDREPAEERELVQNRLRTAEDQIGSKPGWELAKYALVAWIDDMLIEAPWDGRNWWENNSLEFAHFKSRDRATQFFVKAKEAGELSRRDALEIFYVCVVLGFRGLYALSDSAVLADHHELPTDVEDWARRASRSIQLGQGRPAFQDAIRIGDGAPPLNGRFSVVNTWLTTVVLTAFTIVIGYFVLTSRN